MIKKIFSAAIQGIDALPVEVEADKQNGLPGFVIVGLPQAVVKESRERVNMAIVNSGFEFPITRLTINLAPADIRKDGSAFDLPIAIALLGITDQVDLSHVNGRIMIGELSLDGTLKPVKGALSIAVMAKNAGYSGLILPWQNQREVSVIDSIEIIPVDSLKQVVDIICGRIENPGVLKTRLSEQKPAEESGLDFIDIKGQEYAKRAMEVAAAGRHNILLIGPPGSGKSMLAKRIPSILPELTLNETIITTRIHSVAGLLGPHTELMQERPFRAPHHTISDQGMIGGGRHPQPGEVSLANNGVLFLDELPEFRKSALQVLRQPMEDGKVIISRASFSISFPADFMLVAAMNPCPCGFATDPNNECHCQPWLIQKYLSKLSGPLLDRIDIHVEVPPVHYRELMQVPQGESSYKIRGRVSEVQEIQKKRYDGKQGNFWNSRMSSSEVRKYCKLDRESHELLQTAIQKLGFSARAYERILKVARTVADLDGSEGLKAAHLAEAIQYRSLDRTRL